MLVNPCNHSKVKKADAEYQKLHDIDLKIFNALNTLETKKVIKSEENWKIKNIISAAFERYHSFNSADVNKKPSTPEERRIAYLLMQKLSEKYRKKNENKPSRCTRPLSAFH